MRVGRKPPALASPDMIHPMTLLAIMLLAAVPSAAFEAAEDFSGYGENRRPSPAWETTGFFWTVRNGALAFEGPHRSFALPAAAPHGRAGRIAADIVLNGPAGNGWKVTGLALRRNDRDFWQLSLVEDPEGKRRFIELREMLDGFWGAESEKEGAKLAPRDHAGPGEWQYGARYRLVLEFSPEGIHGLARNAAGELVWQVSFPFAPGVPAVTTGRPALSAGGFSGQFDSVEVRVSEAAPAPEAAPPVAKYAGPRMTGRKLKATGFFHVEKKGGRWWLVDPDGYAFFSAGVDHANYHVHWCEKLGYAPYHRNVERRYGSEAAWSESTLARLKSWGFNTLGANQSIGLRHRGLAHVEHILSMGTAFSDFSDMVPKTTWTGFPDVFDPRWEEFCDFTARQACVPAAADPWILGYYIDNELEWEGKDHSEYGLINEIFKKPAGHDAKTALLAFLRKRHRTVEKFNAAWGTRYSGFAALADSTDVPPGDTDEAAKDKELFLAMVAERYFRTAVEAIRRYDPNHLILGCRFWGKAPKVAWRAAGKHLDVVSTNYYGPVDLEAGTAEPIREDLVRFSEMTGRPMMVTEWSYPALDSGLPCRHGAGQRLDTQEQRARAFAVFQRMVAGLPFIVGSQFFMWADEPELGISSTFPEDSNYGLVDVNDDPYPEITAAAARVHPQLAAIHAGDTAELSLEIDSAKKSLVARNAGRQPAECPLAIWEDGQPRRSLVAVPAGGEVRRPLRRDAAYVRAEIDPEESLAEGDRSDNAAAGRLSEVRFGSAPFTVTVANPSALRLDDVTVSLAGIGPGLSRAVPAIEPYGFAVFGVDPASEPAPSPVPLGVPFEIANGELRLRKFEAGGDLIDEVSVYGTVLGRAQVMVHQDDGQKLWIRANRLVSVTKWEGPAETVLEFIAGFAPGIAGETRTAVDAAGREEPRAEPGGAFRARARIRLPRQGGAFGFKLVSVENTDRVPWRFASYFLYLPSSIGGSERDDAQPHPGVPQYYGLNTVWYDPKEEAGYGAVVPETLNSYYWIDEAGSQHPDIYRVVGRVLQPGETWTAEEPEVLVFGFRGAAADRPWNRIGRDLRARQKLEVRISPQP